MTALVRERWHCNCADYGLDGHYICSLCGEDWDSTECDCPAEVLDDGSEAFPGWWYS